MKIVRDRIVLHSADQIVPCRAGFFPDYIQEQRRELIAKHINGKAVGDLCQKLAELIRIQDRR